MNLIRGFAAWQEDEEAVEEENDEDDAEVASEDDDGGAEKIVEYPAMSPDDENPAVDEPMVTSPNVEAPKKAQSQGSASQWVFVAVGIIGGALVIAGVIGVVKWRRQRYVNLNNEKGPLLQSS